MSKILIAEDEPDIQEMMALMLRLEGYEVVTVDNGAEAYAVAQTERPDLILMDVRMPNVDGYQATRLIKSNPNLRDIPIIFVSVRTERLDKQVGLEVGAAGYVSKPFAPSDILRQVRQALAR